MITFPGLRRFVRLLNSKLFFAIAGFISEDGTLAEGDCVFWLVGCCLESVLRWLGLAGEFYNET